MRKAESKQLHDRFCKWLIAKDTTYALSMLQHGFGKTASKIFAWDTLQSTGSTALLQMQKGCALCKPSCIGAFPPEPPLAIIADKLVGLSYPKFALLATRGLLLKAGTEEQRTILSRKTYSLGTAWWRKNYCVKLTKTTSYIQCGLIQQSQAVPLSALRN